MPGRTMQDYLREELAAYAHDAWACWMRYLFSKCEHLRTTDGSEGYLITPELARRWARQMNTKYKDLPADEKLSDRLEADKMLDIMARECNPDIANGSLWEDE